MHIETRVEEIPFKQPLSIAGRTLSGQSVPSIAVRRRVAHAEEDAERVVAVRRARPDGCIGFDATAFSLRGDAPRRLVSASL